MCVLIFKFKQLSGNYFTVMVDETADQNNTEEIAYVYIMWTTTLKFMKNILVYA